MKIARYKLKDIRIPQSRSVHRFTIREKAIALLRQAGLPNVPIAHTTNVKVTTFNPIYKYTENHDKAKWIHELLVEAGVLKGAGISTIRNSQQEGRYSRNKSSVIITIIFDETHKSNRGLDVDTLPLID